LMKAGLRGDFVVVACDGFLRHENSSCVSVEDLGCNAKQTGCEALLL